MHSKLKRPIVAVYVSNKVFNNLVKQRDKQYFKLRALVRANKVAQTTLYFFSYAGVDFNTSLITGIYFDEDTNAWTLRYFPFPDVFHDRINMPTRVRQFHLDFIRKKFAQLQIIKINSCHSFDKWDLYKLLNSNEDLRQHVPHTRKFTSQNDLSEMLQIYSHVYVKARIGKRGMEVMSVRTLPGDNYEYKFHRTQVVTDQIQGLDNLMSVIDSFFRNKYLIIQEAINLLQRDERIIDLRSEVQRNGKGKLNVLGIPFRLGQSKSPVATRGLSLPFERACEELLSMPQADIGVFRKQTESFSLAVYKCVEDCYGPFGELGIDLGLDQHGKIWFIECNAKSGKVSLCNTSDETTINQAFLNPLEYAKYLYKKRN